MITHSVETEGFLYVITRGAQMHASSPTLPCFMPLPMHTMHRTLLKSHLPALPLLGDPIEAQESQHLMFSPKALQQQSMQNAVTVKCMLGMKRSRRPRARQQGECGVVLHG